MSYMASCLFSKSLKLLLLDDVDPGLELLLFMQDILLLLMLQLPPPTTDSGDMSPILLMPRWQFVGVVAVVVSGEETPPWSEELLVTSEDPVEPLSLDLLGTLPYRTESLDIPTAKHFLNLQYWHRFRFSRITRHFPSRRHRYSICFWILRRKKPCVHETRRRWS